MQRWEYRIETFRDSEGRYYNPTPSIDEYLRLVNRLGAEGWEVYGVFSGAVHLKRPVQS